MVFKLYICQLSKDLHFSWLLFNAPNHLNSLTRSQAIQFSMKPPFKKKVFLHMFSSKSSQDFFFPNCRYIICWLSKDSHGSQLLFKAPTNLNCRCLSYTYVSCRKIHTVLCCNLAPKHQIQLTHSRAILFSVKPLEKRLFCKFFHQRRVWTPCSPSCRYVF